MAKIPSKGFQTSFIRNVLIYLLRSINEQKITINKPGL
jgi:chemotaxis methyl-accepting protein methylase